MGSVGAQKAGAGGTLVTGNVSTEPKSSVDDLKESDYHHFLPFGSSENTQDTIKYFDSSENANQKEWEDTLGNIPKAYNAMKDFTGSSYVGYFAKLYTTPWNQIAKEYRTKIAALSEAIRQYDLKQPIITYRRTDYQIFGKKYGEDMSLSELKAMEGKYLHNNSFLSTAASTRGKPVAASRVELKMHIPKGKGIGAFVGKSDLSSLGSSEREFLLNNNLWFRVGKSHYNASKGVNEVDIYIVGRSKGQKFGSDAITSNYAEQKSHTK